ncbi:hypothetical protein CCACVL1_06501 [Corchorus capsularis]|uniref:Uncharacterized protein n=1 Tax=Corchorus capsularis TaxID=210143 RepID=A0A1R3JF41_COCAP|nr:hypothetical protein CCACVL1_06501 [Corchorus capsularis]
MAALNAAIIALNGNNFTGSNSARKIPTSPNAQL